MKKAGGCCKVSVRDNAKLEIMGNREI